MKTVSRPVFSRGLLFAALAAAGALPWLLVTRALLGGYAALALYLVGTVAAYLGTVAAERPRALAASILALVVGMGIACLAGSARELVLGLAIVVAVGRSIVVGRASGGRAVATEVLLVGGGLLFVRFLAGRSPLALLLAIWGFFLVQSFHPLLGGARARQASEHEPDRFQVAYGRAIALLDG